MRTGSQEDLIDLTETHKNSVVTFTASSVIIPPNSCVLRALNCPHPEPGSGAAPPSPRGAAGDRAAHGAVWRRPPQDERHPHRARDLRGTMEPGQVGP